MPVPCDGPDRAPPTHSECDSPFDDATTDENLMDPEGKTADELCTHRKRHHCHPEGKSLSHIRPNTAVKPVLISTFAAMRGFMQLRNMMIMAVMMQQVLGQPKTNEIGGDRWSSKKRQQCSKEKEEETGNTSDGSESSSEGNRNTLCSDNHITEGRGSQKRKVKKTRMHMYMTEKGDSHQPNKNGDEKQSKPA